ncbi:hypothetical protein AVEN_213204-1 [Araneus ventricosus]|uniref:Uncharacterized protein n=1 Tax=Araneus ventricosus TaxID=182803 RepID=A0A4Y2TY30_ARAVE|nr:hypothetical protein AVEN_213204-1 [Araneus ventricosus]
MTLKIRRKFPRGWERENADLTAFLYNPYGPRWPSGKVKASGPMSSRLNPNSTEDPSGIGPVALKRSGQTSSRWCGAEVSRGWCEVLVTRPRFKITSFVPNWPSFCLRIGL